MKGFSLSISDEASKCKNEIKTIVKQNGLSATIVFAKIIEDAFIAELKKIKNGKSLSDYLK